MDPVSTQRDVCSVEKGTVEDDDVETPQMGIRTAIVLFAVLTVVRRRLTLLTVLRAECGE